MPTILSLRATRVLNSPNFRDVNKYLPRVYRLRLTRTSYGQAALPRIRRPINTETHSNIVSSDLSRFLLWQRPRPSFARLDEAPKSILDLSPDRIQSDQIHRDLFRFLADHHFVYRLHPHSESSRSEDSLISGMLMDSK